MNMTTNYRVLVECNEVKISGVDVPLYCAYSKVFELDSNVLQRKYTFSAYGNSPLDALDNLHGAVVGGIMQYVQFVSHDTATPIDRVHLAIMSHVVNVVEDNIIIMQTKEIN